MASSLAGPSWVDEETPVGAAQWAALRRLAVRSRASWKLWVPVALLLGGGAAAARLRKPGQYTVTPVLRVTEGDVRSGAGRLSLAALSAYVDQIALTRANLLELMARRPDVFPKRADPSLAIDDFRDRVDISFTENDFVEDHADTDAPRSARIGIGYRAQTPAIAWAVSHDLANLVIRTILAGQEAEIVRLEAAASTMVAEAAELDDEIRQQAKESAAHPELGFSPTERTRRLTDQKQLMQNVEGRAAAARLSLRGSQEQVALRFEVVDSGIYPHVPSPLSKGLEALAIVLVTLLVAWPIAGAFDPRVIDLADLSGSRLTPLGSFPGLPLPRAPSSGE
jgi:hypothetical protein